MCSLWSDVSMYLISSNLHKFVPHNPWIFKYPILKPLLDNFKSKHVFSLLPETDDVIFALLFGMGETRTSLAYLKLVELITRACSVVSRQTHTNCSQYTHRKYNFSNLFAVCNGPGYCLAVMPYPYWFQQSAFLWPTMLQ